MSRVHDIGRAGTRRRSSLMAARTAAPSEAWQRAYAGRTRWADAAAVVLAVIAAQLLTPWLAQTGLPTGPLSARSWTIGAVLAVLWWAHLEWRGARDLRLIGDGREENRRVVRASLALFAVAAIVLLGLDLPAGRSHVLVALPLGTGLLLLSRWVLRSRLLRERRRGRFLFRALVVGPFAGAAGLSASLRNSPACGLDPVALCAAPPAEPLPSQPSPEGLPQNVLQDGERPTVAGIEEACREHGIHSVVLCPDAPLTPGDISRLARSLAAAHRHLVLFRGPADPEGRTVLPGDLRESPATS